MNPPISRRHERSPVEIDSSLRESQARNTAEIVLLKKYCEVTGDTPNAVHNRRRRGQWVDGVHCHLKSRRRLWINMNEVKKWAANNL